MILAWAPNTESDLAGYRIGYGTSSANYTQQVDVGNNTTGTLSDLTPGITYFIALTAYNTTGLESRPSNEVSYFVPLILPTPHQPRHQPKHQLRHQHQPRHQPKHQLRHQHQPRHQPKHQLRHQHQPRHQPKRRRPDATRTTDTNRTHANSDTNPDTYSYANPDCNTDPASVTCRYLLSRDQPRRSGDGYRWP